jgi:hypothetical protein
LLEILGPGADADLLAGGVLQGPSLRRLALGAAANNVDVLARAAGQVGRQREDGVVEVQRRDLL